MTLEQAESFSWTQAIAELETKAPTLYRILALAVTHSSRRNKQKKGERQFPGLCMAVEGAQQDDVWDPVVCIECPLFISCPEEGLCKCVWYAVHVTKMVITCNIHSIVGLDQAQPHQCHSQLRCHPQAC